MMESQQSTCYTDLSLKKTKTPKLKRKKEFSQLNTGRREKATWNIEKENIYGLIFTTFSKIGRRVYSMQVPWTAQYHQCLRVVETNLH